MQNSVFRLLIFLMTLTFFFNCARRGTPTGGDKDTIPPVLIKAIPSVETINFKDDKIKIFFDEYIKLKDVKQQLVISPPPKNPPIIGPMGTASKYVSIKILDTLKPNTTYLYSFGKSIVDNNEENVLPNFKYVFSTGTYIDSLKLAGEISELKVTKPVKNIDILLYEYNTTYTDSIIFKEKPNYVANTIDSTLFEFTNLKAGKYLMIALKDANFNKIYNPEIDKIGFVLDTIIIPTEKKYNFPLFKEIPKLKFISPKEVNKGHLFFGFEGKATDVSIKLLTETTPDFKSVVNIEEGKDTLNYWFTPFEVDSLNFSVSSGNYQENFTVKLRSTKLDTLNIKNTTGGILHLNDTLTIKSVTPILTLDPSLFQLIEKDSISVPFKAILAPTKNKISIDFEKKHNTDYILKLLPKAVLDIFENSNDSIQYKIKTKNPEDYGIISIAIESSKKNAFIVELLTDKNVVVRKEAVKEPKIISFQFLDSGNYLVRVTIDDNGNGIWDTGNFLEKRQPETIKYFDKTIELRANWDINEVFNLD
ncbi:Ig-like domain-containing protein [Lutibacter sp.]|uniref:Ig-like domain-containing protein n=1 Tax=Lutibacter sp. TaxID=1925666 RepID=UPI002734CE75|nr:Ig-like domain-containing protein [Lutibacter sp.]MDP3314268.1 Ig-like domain-containing protein [Lutibacter sp.]